MKLKQCSQHSVIVAGWRPSIGWFCNIGLQWVFILQSISTWTIAVFCLNITEVPITESDGFYQLTLTMLGIGELRIFEKMKGVSREKIPQVPNKI